MTDSSSLHPPPSPSEDWQAVAPSFERILESAQPFRPAVAALADETSNRRHKRQLRDLLDALEHDVSVDKVFDEGRKLNPLHMETLVWLPDAKRDGRRPSPFSVQHDSAAGANEVLWRSVAYPATLILALLAFALFMWSMLIPEFKAVFEDFGLFLPGPTQLIINAGPFIIAGMAICIAILIGWGFLSSIVPVSLQRKISFFIPWVGKIYRNAAYGKFCHVLSIMLGAGAPRAAAIRVAGRATFPEFVVQRLQSVTRYPSGEPLDSASDETIFDLSPVPRRLALLLRSNIADPERSDALREMASDFYFRSTDGSRSYLEPAIVLVAGLLVGFAVIGLFMPLVSLITNLSG